MSTIVWRQEGDDSPGTTHPCTSGWMTFFEESATSGGLYELSLSLWHRLSLSRPLCDVLSHLPWLITKCKTIFRLHPQHGLNIFTDLFPPHIIAESPLLLLPDELEPGTWMLSWFHNVNGNVTISPKHKAAFDLQDVKSIRLVQRL